MKRFGVALAVACFLIALSQLAIARNVLAQTAAAQATAVPGIRGRVLAAGTELPLAGAIVQARTSEGVVQASTLTAESGIFTFGEISDGTYILRVLRIGFRPFEGPSVTVTGGTSEPVLLNWIGEAVALTPRVISSGRTCKVSADSGTMISNVWTEVRTALISSTLAEQGDAPLITRINYARTVDIDGDLVRQQRLSIEGRRSFRAYASWAPESLAASGYMNEGVVAGRQAMIYRAPDAVTLTSDSFTGTHCFSLVRGAAEHAGEIGLVFEPNSRKNNRVDIRGTFWIQQSTSRLQLIEFSYVGLPSMANRAKAGGYVEFAGLPTGQWLLSRWNIRMPHLAVQTNGFGQNEARVDAVDESGGVVTLVARGDTTLYSKTLPVLTVQLTSAEPLIELSGTKVELDGTELLATTNPKGQVIFRNLLPGRYTLRAGFPQLAMLGAPTREQVISIDTVNQSGTIAPPDAQELLRKACGTRAERSGQVALFGTVRDTSGYPAGSDDGGGDGVVVVRGAVNSATANSGALVDSNGQFFLCTTSRGGTSVRAENALGVGERMLEIPTAALVREVSLSVRPAVVRDTGWRSPLSDAVVEFRVMDSEARPMPKRRVTLVDANGGKHNATTDSFGRAFLLDVPLGRVTIDAGDSALAAPVLVAGRNLVTMVVPEPPE